VPVTNPCQSGIPLIAADRSRPETQVSPVFFFFQVPSVGNRVGDVGASPPCFAWRCGFQNPSIAPLAGLGSLPNLWATSHVGGLSGCLGWDVGGCSSIAPPAGPNPPTELPWPSCGGHPLCSRCRVLLPPNETPPSFPPLHFICFLTFILTSFPLSWVLHSNHGRCHPLSLISDVDPIVG
jgi:hypothetical protein